MSTVVQTHGLQTEERGAMDRDEFLSMVAGSPTVTEALEPIVRGNPLEQSPVVTRRLEAYFEITSSVVVAGVILVGEVDNVVELISKAECLPQCCKSGDVFQFDWHSLPVLDRMQFNAYMIELVHEPNDTYVKRINPEPATSFRVDSPTVVTDALLGVIEPVCERLDVPYFSCRGYVSQSEMWHAARRLMQARRAGKDVVVVHLGDHDPSGIDMSRDIFDRLELFIEGHGLDAAKVERVALNIDQVEEYDPPPNPAKVTDSRFASYVRIHGGESWELDALEPSVLSDVIERAVAAYRDDDAWDAAVQIETVHRRTLGAVADDWSDVANRYDDSE